MIISFWRKYRMEVISWLLTFVCAGILIYFSAVKYGTDDEFIIFRFIDNIASGNGFVYNVGEKILGSTTPLFTLLGAALKYIFSSVPTPELIIYLNLVLISFAGVFFYRVVRSFASEKISLLSVFVFALTLSKAVPEGMESPLFILLLFIFLDFILREKYYASAVAISLVLLTRPDALLIAMLAFIFWWQKKSFKDALRFSALSILVSLPWILFATFYFGTFIPQTIIAKLHTKDIVNIPRIQGFKAQLGAASKLYWGKIFDPNSIILQTIFNLIPYLAVVYLGIWKRFSKDTWIVFAIPAVYFVAFSISNPIMFPWYLTQLEPLWIVISFAGLSVVFSKIKNRFLTGLLCLVVLAGPFYFWLHELSVRDPGKEESFKNIGLYIKDHKKENDVIGLINIGAIGYYSQARIVDFFGIINDYSHHFYPVESLCLDKTRMYSVPPALVMFTKPDWIVLSDKAELPLCFYNTKWFKEKYKSVTFDGAHEGTIWKLK